MGEIFEVDNMMIGVVSVCGSGGDFGRIGDKMGVVREKFGEFGRGGGKCVRE